MISYQLSLSNVLPHRVYKGLKVKKKRKKMQFGNVIITALRMSHPHNVPTQSTAPLHSVKMKQNKFLVFQCGRPTASAGNV